MNIKNLKKKLKKQAEEQVRSFETKLKNEELKTKIDSVNKENFQEVKIFLAEHIKDNFDKKAVKRDLTRLNLIHTPIKLQYFYYNYYLASMGNKVIK